MNNKVNICAVGTAPPLVDKGLNEHFTVVREANLEVRGVAVCGGHTRIDAAFVELFPRLEIVSSFGVGYDHIDAATLARRGIVVTHTPDVLTGEVADLALGLLIATVRQLPQVDRYLRAGQWLQKPYPLTATLRGRKVGILGLGRIGKAIAQAAGGLRPGDRIPRPQAAAGRGLPLPPDAAGPGAELRRADGGGLGRRRDAAHRQPGGAGGAGAGRHRHQRRPRHGHRRAGAGRRAARQEDPVRRPGRVRGRAARAGRTDRDGARGAAAARRLGLGAHAQCDGPAGGRQPGVLVRRQGRGDAGARMPGPGGRARPRAEAMPQARLLALDWGTSSLRAYLLGDGGACSKRVQQPWGILHLPEGGFEAALQGIAGDWLQRHARRCRSWPAAWSAARRAGARRPMCRARRAPTAWSAG